jgi:polar amino acid transport system substrate-binding protein
MSGHLYHVVTNILLAGMILLLAACGTPATLQPTEAISQQPTSASAEQPASTPAEKPTEAPTTGPEFAEDLAPATIKSAGVLRVGSQETYVPAEFHEEGAVEVTGFTADLLKEITRRWGVKLEYVNAQYSALIPGLEADRFDIGSGGMSPNLDRLQVVEMVGYFQSGATFIIKAENAANYPADATAQNLCGKTVGMLQGSSTLQTAFDKENEACAAAGKEPIKIETFDTTPNGLQQVTLGRLEAYTPDFAQTLYIIKTTPGIYSTIGTNYYLVKYPITWTLSKTNPDAAILRDALAKTLSDLMADGTYAAILREWGVEAGAIIAPAVNSLTAEQ